MPAKMLCFIFVSILLSALAYAASKIEVKDAWVGEVPPVSKVAAAYFELENKGNEDDMLVGAASDMSEFIEIHETVVDKQGVAQMKKIDSIKIPARQEVEFKPGGYHLMLINLKNPIKKGDTVSLELHFEKAGVVRVNATVRGGGGSHEGHEQGSH
ncbi:MAG: copper chaperone PCu(A)C [Candidatus Caldarchaeum sp.]